MLWRSKRVASFKAGDDMGIRRFLKKLLIKTNHKRVAFFLISDTLLIWLSLYLAFYLRFEGQIPSPYREQMPLLFLLALLVKIPVFARYGLYTMSWRFVSVRELLNVLKGATFGSIVLIGALFLIRVSHPVLAAFPRSVLFIDYALCLVLIGGFRSADNYIAKD